MFISIALLDEKSTSEQRFSERKPHTLKEKEEERKHQTPRTRPFKEGVSDHQAFHAKLDCTWLRQQSKAPTAAHA